MNGFPPRAWPFPPPACAVRGLLAGRVPPEGPWELQGIELLSQNELYRQILLLLHLLPQDLLLLQVRPLPQPRMALGLPLSVVDIRRGWAGVGP